MKRLILFPGRSESRIYLLDYFVSSVCILLFIVLRSNQKSDVILFLGLLAFAVIQKIMRSKVVVADEKQIRVIFHGKIIRRIFWDDVISMGVWIRHDHPQELYICATPRATVDTFFKKHDKTARNLFPGKRYEAALSSPEGKWEMALAVYLAKRGRDEKSVIVIPMQDKYRDQLEKYCSHEWTTISV